MSEQRRLRSETKQGLHQFLMRLYVSYHDSMTETESKEAIQEILEEQYRFFSPVEIHERSVKQVLTERKEELTTKMESSTGFDEQMWLAEKIDAMQITIDCFDLPKN